MNNKNYLTREVINKNTDRDDVFYIQALEATLEEWNSELDEKAFSDLQQNVRNEDRPAPSTSSGRTAG